MKQRSFFSILAAIVLVLLLIGGGGFYWLSANSPLTVLARTGIVEPAAAMFVPAPAPLMVSLLVNPDQLEDFAQVVAPANQRRKAEEYFTGIKTGLLGSAGLNYERDVQPWLGEEVTFALTSLDLDRNPENGKKPGYLLALSTKDAQGSREFLDLFWQTKANLGANIVFETYQGTKLIYNQAGDAKVGNWASAVVGNQFVLFANNPKVLRDAINNVQSPGLSLASSNAYRRSLQNLTKAKIGFSFINLAQLVALKSLDLPAFNGQASGLANNATLALGLELNPQGLIAQTALLLPSIELGTATPDLSEPVGALRYIPPSVGLLAAGKDLQKFWTQVTEGLSGDASASQFTAQLITTLGDTWGIDLPQDIFSWVSGEYAIAVLPRDGGITADWIFVAEKSADTASSLQHLDDIATQQGFSVGPVKLADRQLSAWTKLTASEATADTGLAKLVAQVRGVRSTIGNYEILTSSVETMGEALEAFRGRNLLASSGLARGISSLPRPNYGYVYLDWKKFEPLLKRRLPLLKLVELAGAPVFQNLQTLTLSSTGGDAGVRRADIFLQIRS